ncbi:hypothetical protein AWB82_02977 [Caballeronia glebae]|uniref:Uncharacterized protein n=1 Tax=Caballeronia glebae TaxID=1777143 RepID=A0A158AUH5_9BURK|nr:hypothetical protein [Caballeronia glebae]SAK61310.1 hypothetical protein AWB82_02977 [Caballeronia glebae]
MRAAVSFAFVLILFPYLLAVHGIDAFSSVARSMNLFLATGTRLARPAQDKPLLGEKGSRRDELANGGKHVDPAAWCERCPSTTCRSSHFFAQAVSPMVRPPSSLTRIALKARHEALKEMFEHDSHRRQRYQSSNRISVAYGGREPKQFADSFDRQRTNLFIAIEAVPLRAYSFFAFRGVCTAISRAS